MIVPPQRSAAIYRRSDMVKVLSRPPAPEAHEGEGSA